jgi:hypothetical protein|tara:strand:+ start:4017 stop:4325 length:309 start_codon:yes stop_codon:yes gene_type:complete
MTARTSTNHPDSRYHVPPLPTEYPPANRYPLLVAIVVSGIAAASLVPVANPQGYFPDALKGSVMKAYEGVGGGDIFSEKAEIINGRAAMLGMGIFIATATIF